MFEERPHREGEPPVRLKTWLRGKGIDTRHSSLMQNLLAYGDELDWSAQPRNVANLFCELVRKVNEALRAATPALAAQPEPAKLPESWASTIGSSGRARQRNYPPGRSRCNSLARLIASCCRSRACAAIRDSARKVAFPLAIPAFSRIPARDGRFSGRIWPPP